MWKEHNDLLELIKKLCLEVRLAVRPLMGCVSAKEIEGHGASGDTTFGIDEVAERVVAQILVDHGNIAYYTEDRGLVVLGDASLVLIIDPIDGTRPAAAGLESCCVSIAASRFDSRTADSLTLGDVFLGAVYEIKNDACYFGLKGHGARFVVEGSDTSPRLSDKTELDKIFWTFGFRGRPAEPLVTVLGDLIDLSSVSGGCFDLGSATFCISRVVLGEMDVYVDPGQRMAADVDAVKKLFLAVGHGAILNNYPYDLAAAGLIAKESGAVVTDAYGGTLDKYPLIPKKGSGQISTIVSGNRTLHSLVLESVDAGMKKLTARYGGVLDGEP